jgi:putative nucleotidyltransferase with HDIG domain
VSTTAESSLVRVTHFTQELVVVLVNLDLYSPTSSHVQESLHNLAFELAAFYALDPDPTLRIELKDNGFYHNGQPLMGATLQAGRLIQLCISRDIASLEFGVDTQQLEILAFLMLLVSDLDRDAFRSHNRERALARHGIKNIKVLQGHELWGTKPPAPSPPVRDPAIIEYQELTAMLQDTHVAAFRGEGLEIERAEGLVEKAVEQMVAEPSRLLALATYDEIDSFTVGHSVRVALLALQVAEACNISRKNLVRVGTAALLHDIGKSRIPQEVLFKRGPLTLEERDIMAQHPRLGGEILLEQEHLDPTAIGAAFCHHMVPGRGSYPVPALPFEPSGISKLVRVCDVFEALTAVRPYKRALQPVEAYVVMRRMTGGFDPNWLRFFIQTLGVHPPGTSVTLNTGAKGLVVATGQTPDTPEIRILTDPAGRPLDAEDQPTVTIGDAVEGIQLEIARAHGSHHQGKDADCDDDRHDHSHDDSDSDKDEGKDNGIDSCCGEELTKSKPNE